MSTLCALFVEKVLAQTQETQIGLSDGVETNDQVLEQTAEVSDVQINPT